MSDQIVGALREVADEIERNPLTAGEVLLVYNHNYWKSPRVEVHHPGKIDALVWHVLSASEWHELNTLRRGIIRRCAAAFILGTVCGALAAMCGVALWAGVTP